MSADATGFAYTEVVRSISAEEASMNVVSLREDVYPAGRCPLLIGDMAVRYDGYITRTMSRSVADELEVDIVDIGIDLDTLESSS